MIARLRLRHRRAPSFAAPAAVLCATAFGLIASPAASSWQRVTSPDGASIDQVSLARTSDDVLHVAWKNRAVAAEEILHTTISANGSVGATNPIVTGWSTVEDPALVATDAGLYAFFAGLRTTDPDEPHRELNGAVSTDEGASWSLRPGSVVPGGAQAYGYDVAASAGPGGSLFQTWAGSLGTWVHAGLSPATPNYDYQAGLGLYGYQPGIATDTRGRTTLAWYSSGDGRRGVLAQAVAPNGAPAGAPMTMPGTSSMTFGTTSRTALVARPRGGFYVAYPTGASLRKVRLWRVGAGSATTITKGGSFAAATVAAEPDGRIWVVWAATRQRGTHVYALRTGPGVSRFGEAVSLGRPKGSGGVYALDASPAPGPGLDVLANFGDATGPEAATYVSRVLPGLKLKAKPKRIKRGERKRVRFEVIDAGEPVRGATVSAQGKRARTSADGKAALKLRGAGRKVNATASHPDYADATVKLKVRR